MIKDFYLIILYLAISIHPSIYLSIYLSIYTYIYITEPNSSQVEFDVVKGLKVDERWISSDRRKGNKERSYPEAVTGNSLNSNFSSIMSNLLEEE